MLGYWAVYPREGATVPPSEDVHIPLFVYRLSRFFLVLSGSAPSKVYAWQWTLLPLYRAGPPVTLTSHLCMR